MGNEVIIGCQVSDDGRSVEVEIRSQRSDELNQMHVRVEEVGQ